VQLRCLPQAALLPSVGEACGRQRLRLVVRCAARFECEGGGPPPPGTGALANTQYAAAGTPQHACASSPLPPKHAGLRVRMSERAPACPKGRCCHTLSSCRTAAPAAQGGGRRGPGGHLWHDDAAGHAQRDGHDGGAHGAGAWLCAGGHWVWAVQVRGAGRIGSVLCTCAYLCTAEELVFKALMRRLSCTGTPSPRCALDRQVKARAQGWAWGATDVCPSPGAPPPHAGPCCTRLCSARCLARLGWSWTRSSARRQCPSCSTRPGTWPRLASASAPPRCRP